MPSIPRYPRFKSGRQIPVAGMNRLMSDVQAGTQQNYNTAGLTAQITPFGTYYHDPRPQRFPAFLTGEQGGSGLGGVSGSNIDDGALPADDQTNAYGWVEAYWTVENDEFVLVEKPFGRFGSPDSCPALEARGATDMEAGEIVMLEPGWGAPDFYYFFAPGAVSGSGGTGGFRFTCNEDGSGGTLEPN